MTDDRAKQLARAMTGINIDDISNDSLSLVYARRALAAVDADPETYGYVRF